MLLGPALPLLSVLSNSIWKGNEPSPEEAVDDCDTTERPSNRRFGGGSGDGGTERTSSLTED